MRLLKKIGSPSGVRRQTWLGTMSTSCESSRSRVVRLAQREQRLLVLPGYGGHDEHRKCRDGQKKLQHDLLLPLGLGIADKLAGAGYREYHRDQSEEGQGDGGASELEAHRGPKKRRHDDVGGGQMTAQGKGGDTKKDQPQDAGFHPPRGRELRSCRASSGTRPAPVAPRSRPRWRLRAKIEAKPPRRFAIDAKPRKCRTSHRRAYDRRNSGAQYDQCENFLQGFQPNRPSAGPVHEPCADHRFKSVADIDQEADRQRIVEPHDVARTFQPGSPPAPTTASCAWRRKDKRSDEKPARRPNGNTYSRDDCERLSESAAQDICRNEKPPGAGIGGGATRRTSSASPAGQRKAGDCQRLV